MRGRSISQEAEIRLEQSFDREGHLILSQNDIWSSVFTHGSRTVFRDASHAELWVILGDDPRDVNPGEYPHEEHVVVLKIDRADLKRLQNYFSGAPFPWDYSNEEIQAAGDEWIQQQSDLRRGK